MDWLLVAIFSLVYLGMMLGRIPGLALDRSGVALLGAICLFATGRVTDGQLFQAVDVPTLALLFGLMILSAQFRLGGFYSHVVRLMSGLALGPPLLLGLLMGVAALLSSLLANDIVCLAMAPVLVELCARKDFNPLPFLLGLACASNIGSAATLIGNPQNMLIGQMLKLSFSGYLGTAAVPSMAALASAWLILLMMYKRKWWAHTSLPDLETPEYDSWQTAKGALLTLALVAAFLWGPWPREVCALVVAGVLMCSRRMHSGRMLGLVDWPLLVLFVGLFVVNFAMSASGLTKALAENLRAWGLEPGCPSILFWLTAALSNLVSNVPAVMLLIPYATQPPSGETLALSSTLAGNLLVVGSIANIIVVDQAARLGVTISWLDHAKVGVPVTIVSLAIAFSWLYLM